MSKLKPFLSDLLMVAITILFAAILTGCGQTVATPPNPEEELAACRAVLDEIKSHDSYHIFSHTDYVSDWVLNTFSDVHFWKSDNDWFCTSRPTDASVFAYLYKDGRYFNNNNLIAYAREDDIKWNSAGPTEERQPWLYSFDWDAQDVSHVSTALSADSRIITILVHDRWERGTSKYDIAENYTVDFHFTKKGTFEKAVLNLSFAEDGTETETETMTIVSTDAQEIAARLQKEYDSAMNQQGETTPENREYLDACRAVLEEIQSHSSYHITVEAENGASRFTNQYFLHGDDRLFIGDSQNKNNAWVGVDAYLRRNGELFEAEMPGTGHDLNEIQWTKAKYYPETVENYIPWIYDIDWDAQEVSLVSKSFGPGGGSIDVLFKTPYVFPGGLNPVAENYTVQFIMDSAMNLREAIMRASYHHKPEYQEYDFMMTQVFTASTDETEIAARIDREYQRALTQNSQ